MCISQLLDVVYREETLLNVIRSVTKNGRSILLTALLAVILIYLFSIVGFIAFRDDFIIEVDALLPNPDSSTMGDDVSGFCSADGCPDADNVTETALAGASLSFQCDDRCAKVRVVDVAGAGDDDDDGSKERHCDSLIMCIVTTLNEGLRNGGGIGDVLRKPSSAVSSERQYT